MARNGKSMGYGIAGRLKRLFRCTITPTPAVPSHSHRAALDPLAPPDPPTDFEIDLVKSAVLSHTRRPMPIPSVRCNCGDWMFFSRLAGRELDVTCLKCRYTITLTPKE